MAYSNLTTFASALASHGKNFQQYLDGVPTLTLRQAAGSDLNNFLDGVASHSGNSYSNMKSLATLLASGREVQNELSHTTLSMRNGARTEWAQFITDFNAMEVADGESAGSYGATTTLINAILAAGMPNDLGQWSDKLTTSQISNAATALAAMGTASDNTSAGLFGIDGLTLFMDAEVGITGGGDEDTGTGTSDLVSAWQNRAGGRELFVQATGTKQPIYDGDGIGGRGALFFDGARFLKYVGQILSGQTGGVFVLYHPTTFTSAYCYFSQSDNSTDNYVAMYSGIGSNAPRFNLVDGGASTQLYASYTGTFDDTVLEFSSDGSLITAAEDGTARTIVEAVGTNTGQWFGDLQTLSTCIGILHTAGEAYHFEGWISAIVAYDGVTLTTAQKTIINNYLVARGGI